MYVFIKRKPDLIEQCVARKFGFDCIWFDAKR